MRYPARRRCRAARRRLLSPDSTPEERDAALEELMGFVRGGDRYLRGVAAKAIIYSQHVRPWLPPGRTPAQIRADERRALTQLKRESLPEEAPDRTVVALTR